jgi:hypothetical protein
MNDSCSPVEPKALPTERMKMWPISARVNSPENDDEAIIEPIKLGPLKIGPGGPDAELPLT